MKPKYVNSLIQDIEETIEDESIKKNQEDINSISENILRTLKKH